MTRSSVHFTALALSAVIDTLLLATPAHAAPRSATPQASCQSHEDSACQERKKREEEQNDAARPGDGGPGTLNAGSSIVPCLTSSSGSVCGISSDTPPVTRGPLNVRRLDVSLGLEHALSRQWVIGGLVGFGRGRVQRWQSEPSSLGGLSEKDTTVRSRNASLTGVLTWLPRPTLAVDASLAYQRTRFEFERSDRPDNRSFVGEHDGHAWSFALTASSIQRYTGMAIVPQAGLEFVSNSVDPLSTTRANPPPGSTDSFEVSSQHTRTLSAQVGVQAQWPRSVSFGTVTPYTRAVWQQRVWERTAPVETSTPGKPSITSDDSSHTSRHAITLAGGLLTQLSGGTSLFADIGYTRGADDLRETRLSLGVKFER